jgi:hypothetical protein
VVPLENPKEKPIQMKFEDLVNQASKTNSKMCAEVLEDLLLQNLNAIQKNMEALKQFAKKGGNFNIFEPIRVNFCDARREKCN